LLNVPGEQAVQLSAHVSLIDPATHVWQLVCVPAVGVNWFCAQQRQVVPSKYRPALQVVAAAGVARSSSVTSSSSSSSVTAPWNEARIEGRVLGLFSAERAGDKQRHTQALLQCWTDA
jgi:hypothetical protein